MWRRIGSGTLTLLIVISVFLLWPARLGGGTRLVIVSGHSMEPTYDLGDIVVARDGTTPEVGDIVVFAVPEGTGQGMLVIHRILEVDADGNFITQGDNRDTPDQWKLSENDIVGEPLVRIPKGGVVVEFLEQLWVIALVLGLLVMLLLWPSSDDPPEAEDEPEQPESVSFNRVLTDQKTAAGSTVRSSEDAVAVPVLGDITARESISNQTVESLDSLLILVGIDVTAWAGANPVDHDVTVDVDADAEAWLDAELARSGHLV